MDLQYSLPQKMQSLPGSQQRVTLPSLLQKQALQNEKCCNALDFYGVILGWTSFIKNAPTLNSRTWHGTRHYTGCYRELSSTKTPANVCCVWIVSIKSLSLDWMAEWTKQPIGIRFTPYFPNLSNVGRSGMHRTFNPAFTLTLNGKLMTDLIRVTSLVW